MHSITRRARRPRYIFAWVLALSTLTPLFLSGCGGGGGGGGTTDEGFRFVPAGSGPVIPFDSNLADAVHFEYDSGAVSSGIIVTANSLAAVSSAPNGDTPADVLPITPRPGLPAHPAAYKINFTNVSSAHFNIQPRLYLAYNTPAPQNSTPRIFLYDPTSKTWTALPISAASPTPAASAGTAILEVLLPATINTGSIVAVFADTVPSPPPPTLLP